MPKQSGNGPGANEPVRAGDKNHPAALSAFMERKPRSYEEIVPMINRSLAMPNP